VQMFDALYFFFCNCEVLQEPFPSLGPIMSISIFDSFSGNRQSVRLTLPGGSFPLRSGPPLREHLRR